MRTFEAEMTGRMSALIDKAERIVIVTHTHPDGDALGSTSALLHYLTHNRSRKASVILPDAYPAVLGFTVEKSKTVVAATEPQEAASLFSEAELIFCLDFNTPDRAASLAPLIRSSAVPKILIDHHLNPLAKEFDLVFSETEVSSASELVYDILLAMPDVNGTASLPEACLKSLMVGMTTDTNNFANSVFPSTLSMASDLLSAGVDRDAILVEIYNRYGENRYRAMGAVLSELMKITDEGVAYFIMDKFFLEKYGLGEGDTEGFVNLPLGIDRVKISIFLKEDDGYFRVSVRSKAGWSANRLAVSYFNGGGHECAAGGRLYFPKDVKQPSDAPVYIESVTARFMRAESPAK